MCKLGRVALALNENDVARQTLKESLSLSREQGLRSWFPQYLLGIVALRQGQPSQARRHLYEALQEVTESRDLTECIEVLPAIPLFLSDQREGERAVTVFALASSYPYVANSRWFEDVVGKHIAAVATTLPPEVVAAAQERGRARDLWATAEELLVELGG
jgi:hypothetical protein